MDEQPLVMAKQELMAVWAEIEVKDLNQTTHRL